MDSFAELVRDQLRRVPALRTRRMFGGSGFYSGAVFFGMVYDGRIYFKTGESERTGYTARGSSGPFTYEGGALISLWEVPTDVLEDADELEAWAYRAIAAARVAKREPRRRPRGA
jgi:DNA transformation protein and related proteins